MTHQDRKDRGAEHRLHLPWRSRHGNNESLIYHAIEAGRCAIGIGNKGKAFWYVGLLLVGAIGPVLQSLKKMVPGSLMPYQLFSTSFRNGGAGHIVGSWPQSSCDQDDIVVPDKGSQHLSDGSVVWNHYRF